MTAGTEELDGYASGADAPTSRRKRPLTAAHRNNGSLNGLAASIHSPSISPGSSDLDSDPLQRSPSTDLQSMHSIPLAAPKTQKRAASSDAQSRKTNPDKLPQGFFSQHWKAILTIVLLSLFVGLITSTLVAELAIPFVTKWILAHTAALQASGMTFNAAFAKSVTMYSTLAGLVTGLGTALLATAATAVSQLSSALAARKQEQPQLGTGDLGLAAPISGVGPAPKQGKQILNKLGGANPQNAPAKPGAFASLGGPLSKVASKKNAEDKTILATMPGLLPTGDL